MRNAAARMLASNGSALARLDPAMPIIGAYQSMFQHYRPLPHHKESWSILRKNYKRTFAGLMAQTKHCFTSIILSAQSSGNIAQDLMILCFVVGCSEEGRALHRSPMCIAISLILPYGLALETSALTNSYPNRGECDTECLDFCRVLRV